MQVIVVATTSGTHITACSHKCVTHLLAADRRCTTWIQIEIELRDCHYCGYCGGLINYPTGACSLHGAACPPNDVHHTWHLAAALQAITKQLGHPCDPTTLDLLADTIIDLHDDVPTLIHEGLVHERSLQKKYR